MNASLPVFPEGDTIPRLIHQTYPRKALPPALQGTVERLCARNPEWRHQLYDDNDIREFIGAHYGDRILAAYDRIDPDYGAARADLFRYLLLYRTGGVYLDIKSGCAVPLDSVILPGDRYLLSHWHRDGMQARRRWGAHSELAHLPEGELQQWYIACASGHPFLRDVLLRVLRNLERYNPLVDGIGRLGVLRMTGPIAYTLAITPILARYSHRLWENREDTGLIYNTVNAGDPEFYKSQFPAHYTRSNRPIVLCGPVTTRMTMTAATVKRAAGRLLRSLGLAFQRRA
jgi:hypothetical protein